MASNRLFLAFREHGPSWVPGVPTREQPLWDEHAAFMDELFARGHVVLAGPYADLSRALVILDAGDAAEASALLRGDPWETAGILVPGQIVEWVLFLDSRKKS
ncbi:MAG TPA: YciI family protein [Gemmataceae bacterium]|nr:YciI family protein [Gemmataceae bacterium]